MLNIRSLFWSLTAIFCIYSIYVWTVGTEAPQSGVASEQVQRGHDLYQANNCTACHQIYGLGGYMGPDLTNVISEKGEAYASVFITNGTVAMPDFGFDAHQVEDLVSFLAFVDTMGIYQAPEYQVSWYGTVASNP
jgi:nitric oxide reductase subunit C